MAGRDAVSRWMVRSAMTTAAVGLAAGGIGFIGTGAAAAAHERRCTSNVGGTGLSAAVVARSHQKIANRAINAKGCDIGMFVGKSASHVTIDSVVVSGARFQGILAQKTSHLTIEHSTITDNGFKTTNKAAPPQPGSGVKSFVSQAFAISLFGVSQSTVADNSVFNNGRGGIGVMDNGPNDPGALKQNRSAPLVSSSHDRILNNSTWKNYNGCGIVLATQNLGGRLSHLVVSGNTVIGMGRSKTNGPDIGGVVVAADPPNSSVRNVRVSANTVAGSFEGGVIVNAEAFNSSTKNVHVTGNTVSGNNWGRQEAPKTAGIIVFANPAAQGPPHTNAPVNMGAVVAGNTATDQFYGIWSAGKFRPKVTQNHIQVTAGGTRIART